MRLPLPILVLVIGLLGATSLRAQFTQSSLTTSPATAPASPLQLNVGQTYTSALTITISFNQLGTSINRIEIRNLPPGLTAGGVNEGDLHVVTNRPNAVIFGTPTTPGDYTLNVTAVTSTGLNSIAQVPAWLIYLRIAASGTAPTITTQPASVTTAVGGSATFTVAASGDPAPTYQWRRDGTNIAGATSATLTLNNVTAANAGAYSVVVTNAAGSVTSANATLTLATQTAPAFLNQPIGVTVVGGGTLALNAQASGNPAPTYQWRRNGTNIVGATNATLVVNNASAAEAGSYTVVATNAAGTVTSAAASVNVAATADVGRLSNLSILTVITATEPKFTLGTVISGSGSKPLLVRAAGPSLAPLGVGSPLADPKLDLFAGTTLSASNDDWGGGSALASAFAQVGAFGFLAATSKDAAVYNPTLPTGSYSVEVSGVGGATGPVIAELYDASAAFTASTPRLINVSVLKPIGSGTTLTAGFVIAGGTAQTVLIRAIGPALGVAPFNIGGVMADPKLDLYAGQTLLAANDNWAGDPQLTSVGTRVGAFAVADAGSRDAMLLVTLPPSAAGYTAQVSGVGGGGGFAIVEVYAVP